MSERGWVSYWFPGKWERRVFGEGPHVVMESPGRIRLATEAETLGYAPPRFLLLPASRTPGDLA